MDKEQIAQIDELYKEATEGEWEIGAYESGRMAIDSSRGEEVTGWIDTADAALIIVLHNIWPTISAELKRLREELGMTVFQKNLLEESFNMAMAEVGQQQTTIEKAREALAANHQWHKDYDDHDNYPGSELCQMNEQALVALDGAQDADLCPMDELPTVDELERDADDGWISVKDRLPDEWEDTIVYRKSEMCGDFVSCGYWFKDKNDEMVWSVGDVKGPSVIAPTHWRPLPAPPKGGEQ